MTSSPHSDEPEQPTGPAARAGLKLIGWYQKYLSPMKFGSTCRFEPTCSLYGAYAIRYRGFLRGSVLALARILKCGPWHPGGFDPPPGWTEPSFWYYPDDEQPAAEK